MFIKKKTRKEPVVRLGTGQKKTEFYDLLLNILMRKRWLILISGGTGVGTGQKSGGKVQEIVGW